MTRRTLVLSWTDDRGDHTLPVEMHDDATKAARVVAPDMYPMRAVGPGVDVEIPAAHNLTVAWVAERCAELVRS